MHKVKFTNTQYDIYFLGGHSHTNRESLIPIEMRLQAVPGIVSKHGLALKYKKSEDRYQVVINDKIALLNSIKNLIYIEKENSTNRINSNKFEPAYLDEDYPSLWSKFLEGDYDETKDPPLRLAYEYRDMNAILLNYEKLLLDPCRRRCGEIKFAANGGISLSNMRTSLSQDGIWLYYLTVIDNAINSAQPWKNLTEARKDLYI